jgi:hypothetical protein
MEKEEAELLARLRDAQVPTRHGGYPAARERFSASTAECGGSGPASLPEWTRMALLDSAASFLSYRGRPARHAHVTDLAHPKSGPPDSETPLGRLTRRPPWAA